MTTVQIKTHRKVTKLSYKSYAKINLFLKIIGKTNDGFHHLESIISPISLADFLTVEISDKFDLKIDGEFKNSVNETDNLMTKILKYFVENFHISTNLKIRLTKNIPVAAGLGGGSSNAAYFMIALNEIFKLNLSKEKLQEISFNFGSDIAFFFEEKTSIIRGRGHISESYKNIFKPIEILLINPKISLSTKEVFSNFKENFSKEITDKILQNENISEILELPNDLTNSAISIVPEINNILKNLEQNNAIFAKMSGSGASCFGIFKSKEDLKSAEKRIKKLFSNYFVTKTEILYEAPK